MPGEETWEGRLTPGAAAAAVRWQGDERLLKLYESGLPAWAIYMPLYGLPYRPWLRALTYALFIAVSIFSMAMGFYDLIKNFPLLHRVRAHCVAHLF